MSVVETARLVLRPVTVADAPFLLQLFSHPDVHPWSGDGLAMPDLAAAGARAERYATRGGDHPATGVWVVVPHGADEPAGVALLVPLPSSEGVVRDDVEVGWHLHPRAWGQGHATEAGATLLERAWAHGIDEVHAVTHPANVRSQAVCRRLGMTDLGLRTDWYDRELRAFRVRPGR